MDERQKRMLAHVAKTMPKQPEVMVPDTSMGYYGAFPVKFPDAKRSAKMLEHVSRSLGNFAKTAPTFDQIVAHLSQTDGK